MGWEIGLATRVAMGSMEQMLGQFMDSFVLLLFFFFPEVKNTWETGISQISSEHFIKTQFQRQGKEDIA